MVDEILPRVFELLGERKDDPPYFTAHAFGSAALVHDARGDPAATELIALLRRHAETAEGEWPRLSLIWLAWVLARRGEIDGVDPLLETLASVPSGITRPLEDQIRAEIIALHRRWDDAPEFLGRSRGFARMAELIALPVHLDRLEGRTALAAGDLGPGLEIMRRAREGFEDLGAAWERARTELDLAEALTVAGRDDAARTYLQAATPDLERVGARIEIERSRDLRGRLG